MQTFIPAIVALTAAAVPLAAPVPGLAAETVEVALTELASATQGDAGEILLHGAHLTAIDATLTDHGSRIGDLEAAPAPASTAAAVTNNGSFNPNPNPQPGDPFFGGDADDNASVQSKLDYLAWRTPRFMNGGNRNRYGEQTTLEDRLTHTGGISNDTVLIADNNFPEGTPGPSDASFVLHITNDAQGADALNVTLTLVDLENYITLQGLVDALNRHTLGDDFDMSGRPRPFAAEANRGVALRFASKDNYRVTFDFTATTESAWNWMGFYGLPDVFDRGQDYDVSYFGVYNRSTGKFLSEEIQALQESAVVLQPDIAGPGLTYIAEDEQPGDDVGRMVKINVDPAKASFSDGYTNTPGAIRVRTDGRLQIGNDWASVPVGTRIIQSAVLRNLDGVLLSVFDFSARKVPAPMATAP